MGKSFIARMFAPAKTRREIEEAYLNQSVSRYDLERRMKEIEQGKFR